MTACQGYYVFPPKEPWMKVFEAMERLKNTKLKHFFLPIDEQAESKQRCNLLKNVEN